MSEEKQNMMTIAVVGCAWIAGMVCCAFLVMNDHPWFGAAVLIFGMSARCGTVE